MNPIGISVENLKEPKLNLELAPGNAITNFLTPLELNRVYQSVVQFFLNMKHLLQTQ